MRRFRPPPAASQLPGPGRLNRSRPRPSHSPEARLDLLTTPAPRRDIGWMSPGSLTALVVPGGVRNPVEMGGRGSGFLVRLGGGPDSFGTVIDLGGRHREWPQLGVGIKQRPAHVLGRT